MLLQREFDRVLASLRLEEMRNRDAAANPPRSTTRRLIAALRRRRNAQLYRLLVDAGLIADKPYFRVGLVGADRRLHAARQAQFLHATSPRSIRCPLSHQFHWIELARLRA